MVPPPFIVATPPHGTRPIPGSGASAWASERHRAIAETGLSEWSVDEALDRYTALAAELLHAPIAFVSFVDDERTFFPSCVGLPEPYASSRSLPVADSVCQFVARDGAPLLVDDARQHPLLADLPVVGAHAVVAYAGVPVRSVDGQTLGSFCVIDSRPRAWSEADRRILEGLGAAVSNELAVRSLSRRADADLSAMDASYREVIDTLDEVVFATDAVGRWTWLSPAWSTVTGHTIDASLGRPAAAYLHPDDAPAAAAGFADMMAGALDDYRGTARYLSADGTERWISIRSRPVIGPDGEPTGCYGRLHDVTERVLAERQVREREDELARTRRHEALGRFAAGIVHDFNNILLAIGGHADLLADAHLLDDDRECLTEIADAVRRGTALTAQLAAFGRRAQSPVGSAQPSDVNALTRGVIGMLGRVLGGSITVDLRLADEPLHVRLGESQLEQVLTNLFMNARDAMPDGGDIVIASGRTHDPEGASAWLRVSDTGHGMDASVLERLFDPYFTTKQERGGTGLGLATVHAVVANAGGRVDVSSAPDRGTTFTITLPLAD